MDFINGGVGGGGVGMLERIECNFICEMVCTRKRATCLQNRTASGLDA
jgi:hypothetical protein